MVEIPNRRVIGVREQYFHPTFSRAFYCRSQTLLILPTEDPVVVLCETIKVVPRYVWWVDKDEVPFVSAVQHRLKVRGDQFGPLENCRDFFKVIGVQNY